MGTIATKAIRMNLNNIKREDFSFIKTVEARWVDMDALRHINNSVYLSKSKAVKLFLQLFFAHQQFVYTISYVHA